METDFSKQNVQYVISAIDLQKFGDELVTRFTKAIELRTPPTIQSDEKLLSVDQTAAFFGVSRQTVYNWKREGKLTYCRKGGRVFFKQSELINNLEQINLRKY